ncbi:MAG: efflux RND transporter permease subunit [Gammaproteobacteria bacterium]|nr:efflux RND transporter permease subunit [Gammaproteobacteria bacterium]
MSATVQESSLSGRLRRGGIAAWSVRHPVGVSMLALAIIVLGLFSLQRLGVDLLPHIIYPEVRVRILDPGVPAAIVEDQITRQLEEQLAITEDAISVQSSTSEGASRVDLTFSYGKDIDVALRDASTRLDRAKRFLPDTIDPPIIFKRDPSQIPALEFAISSALLEPSALRGWIDYVFANWFLNLPGVAAVEVGGAPVREILVLPDQARLAGYDLTLDAVIEALRRGNVDVAGGPLHMSRQELSGRTAGRFGGIGSIAELPVGVSDSAGGVNIVRLQDVAEVVDGYADERLRVRLNGVPGLKVSVQKQPTANTVAVVDEVRARLEWLKAQDLIPEDVQIDTVSDQSIYIRQSIFNAASAAVSGALLAMLVVYLFLGDLRRTLIIGTGIPIATMVALVLMASAGLTLNIMTLGGLALGVGMLIDNTIVMLENVYRHQRGGESPLEAASNAAAEVNSAIVASTTTNLAAVLPFLFIGGLVGLLFRELIATISASIVASLVVALTLVPALGARVVVGQPNAFRRGVDALVGAMQRGYASGVRVLLRVRWLVPLPFIAALAWAVPVFQSEQQVFLPRTDDGRVYVNITADGGINLDVMDQAVTWLEKLILAQPEVETAFSQIGGFVFGRSEYQRSNRSRIQVQLKPLAERGLSSSEWIKRVRAAIDKLQLAGIRAHLRSAGIRGIRVNRGDDDISIRVQGQDLTELAHLGDELVARLAGTPGLRNLQHSLEDTVQELAVVVDRERSAALGFDIEEVGRAVRIALQGLVVTDYIENDRQYDVRVRLPRRDIASPRDVESVLLFGAASGRESVYLSDLARVDLVNAPASIVRDRQQRIVEVSGSVAGGSTLGEVTASVQQRLEGLELPSGYTMYDGGGAQTLRENERLALTLLGVAIFLVLVVMAVQYESLRAPLVILCSVPFAAIGVALAVTLTGLTISMPLWLGMIMLAGVVVNNAIVLVEYIEIERDRGAALDAAIIDAARLRLRPILMTTLTTIVGMTPLAVGLGEGSELLQPLAITMVWGLGFSTLVTLVLVPAVYHVFARRSPVGNGAADSAHAVQPH